MGCSLNELQDYNTDFIVPNRFGSWSLDSLPLPMYACTKYMESGMN